jgi:hypothetical protein
MKPRDIDNADIVDVEQVLPLRERELRHLAAQPALGVRDGHTLAGSHADQVGSNSA